MTSVPTADRQHFRRLLYPIATTVGVGFGAILYGFSVLVTTEAAGAVWSATQLSAAFSGSVLTGALVAVPVGRRADRHGVRGIIGIGGVLVFLGFVGFALSRTPVQLFASWWLLIGPGSAMILFEPAFVAIQQWFDRDDRNRAAATLTVVTGLAGPIFLPGTSALVSRVGWRPTAIVLGSLVLLVALTTAGPALRVAPRPASAEGHVRWRLRTHGMPPGFLALSCALALAVAVLEATFVHRIARFEATGFNPGVLALWAGASSLLSLPGRFVLPRLANRWPSPRLLAAVLAALLPAAALAVRGTTTWEMAGHFTVFGLAYGAIIPLRAVVMSDWYGGATFGALMGVQAVAVAGGRAGGPVAVGWLADSPAGYAAGMAVLVIFLLGSITLVGVAVRRHRQRKQSPDGAQAEPSHPVGAPRVGRPDSSR